MNLSLFVPIVLGLAAGYFINYVSDVLPHSRRFSHPICSHCQASISWTDYLALRACRQCGKGRSLRTWLALVATSACFLYFWLNPSKAIGLPLSLVVFIYFAVITVIDLEHRLILHPTSVFGAIVGLIVGTVIHSNPGGILVGVGNSLFGGLAGFGVMFLLYQFGTLVARFRARKMQAAGLANDEEEALGGGDVTLAGVLGLMLGWPFIMNALVYGVLLGGLVSLLLVFGLILRRKYSSEALMLFIPYGPYFILGAFFVLFL